MPTAPALHVEGLSKTYEARPVLRDVSLDVEPGAVFSLCGDSGAGKTTLVRIVAGLLGFDAGEIRIAGQTFAWAEPLVAAAALHLGLAFALGAVLGALSRRAQRRILVAR